MAAEFATDDTITPGQFRTMTATLRDRLAVVEDAQADAARVSVLGPLVGVEDVETAWNALDVDRRRAVVDALMTVRLHKPGRGHRTFETSSVEIARKVA